MSEPEACFKSFSSFLLFFSGGSACRSFLFCFNKVSNNRAYPAEEKTTPGGVIVEARSAKTLRCRELTREFHKQFYHAERDVSRERPQHALH